MELLTEEENELEFQLQALEFQSHTESINACRLLNNDRVIATCSDDCTVAFWNISTREQLVNLSGHLHYVKDFDIDEASHQVLSASWDKSAILWDYTTQQQLWSANHESLCTSCHTSKNINMTAVACDNSHFYLWDTRMGEKVCDSRERKGHTNTITCCRFSHDGLALCTTSMDRISLIWDVRMMRSLLKLCGHINVVTCCAFSHDDRYLCTSSWDKTLRLFDISTGSYRTDGGILLRGHDGCVSACEFSTDDSQLVSCGYDLHVALWNTHSKRQICSLKGHNNWIQDVHISKDKRWIVTCSKDGMVKVWDTEAGDLKQRKKYIGLNMSKCEQCGRMFSSVDPPDSHCLCVFCRLQSPQRPLETLATQIH